MLTSAFGASIAASMATAYGCAGMSSGKINTGVWQLRTKSRVTVKTKSGLVRYIFVRNLSTISIVTSGPPRYQLGAPGLHVVFVEQIAHLRARSARLRQHRRNDTIGRPSQQVPDQGTADAKSQHHELVDAQMIHQAKLIVGVGIPRPLDLERAGGLTSIGV